MKECRRCKICKRIVFTLEPQKNILGLAVMKTKEVRPYKYIENERGYFCMDCLQCRSRNRKAAE